MSQRRKIMTDPRKWDMERILRITLYILAILALLKYLPQPIIFR